MVENIQVDLLAFGAHPDDVEIGASGILATHHQAGWKVGICDLTEAELSSNGSVELRKKEAQKAAEVLGVDVRICLSFPDRGLTGDKEQLQQLTQVIRRSQPKVVLAPYFRDRHPDHVACSRLVEEAVFNAALRNWKTAGEEEPHRIEALYYYFINDVASADVIVDISDVYQQKVDALQAYESQFFRHNGEVNTPINQNYLEVIKGRDQMWGHQIGTNFGEALVSSRPIRKQHLIDIV